MWIAQKLPVVCLLCIFDIVFYLYWILKRPAVMTGKKVLNFVYDQALMLIFLLFVNMIFTRLLYFRPTIGGRTEERLCGYGPDLSVILRKDAYLVRLRRKVIKFLNVNFEAAVACIQKFEFVRHFIAENEEKSHDSIENEMGTDICFLSKTFLVIL